MTFNSCPKCGSIKENATIKLSKLRKKIEKKIYELKYGGPSDMFENPSLTRQNLEDWSETIRAILGEL